MEEKNTMSVRAEIQGTANPAEPKEGKKPFAIPFGIVFLYIGIAVLSFIYFAYGRNFEIPSLTENVALPILFLFGLVTGIHCIGMCGSFMVAYSSKGSCDAEGKPIPSGDVVSHLSFGLGKLISYTLIGGLFGLVGSFITFSPELRGGIGVLAGVFLIIYGLNMLNIFPALRALQLRLPSIATASSLKGKGPFAIGLANGLFLACGPLQAMYIYAAGTGSAISGASALFAFGLGTLPFMMLFGLSLATLSRHLHKIIKFSGALVIILGLFMANNGFNLLGIPLLALPSSSSNSSISVPIQNLTANETQVQEIRMTVDSYGWSPDTFTLKQGVRTRWIIDVKELTGCNKEIIVRDYNLDIKLHIGENIVEFTPDKKGTIRWSCWMGMIPGTFNVE